jgi:FG-GAP-like repeat
MIMKLPRHVAYAAAIIAATTLIVVSSTPTKLQFLGMSTVFGLSKHDKSGLLRQADCSITQYGFSFSARALIPATNFQDSLHQLAGLTTKPDVFAKGCKDPVLGIQSTHAAYLGKSPTGLYLGVQGATDHVTDLVVYAANPSTLAFTSTTLAANVLPQVLGVDLNKDGFTDVIAAGVTDSTSHKTGIGVFLSNGDGTFKPGVVYGIATSAVQAFIADDLNGDGVPDILVPNSSSGGTPQLTALLGKGDGSFTTGPTTAISLTTPLTLYGLSQPIVTGDFNGDGKVDVITADGMMYPGNGDGSFGAGHQALGSGIT